MNNYILACLLLFSLKLSASNIAIKDTLNKETQDTVLPYELFPNSFVMYADLGYYQAPFNISDDYSSGVSTLAFRNNSKLTLGVGFAYKWFALRLGFALPWNMLPTEKYTNTKYFDAGLHFSLKKTYWSIDLRRYKGYALVDAHKWHDSISEPFNILLPEAQSNSFSINMWYFKDKRFNIKAAIGKVGHLTGKSRTWYFKGTFNVFQVSNDVAPIVPVELIDTTERKKATKIGAADLGFVPGYVFGNRKNNWQYTVLLGLGGVVQGRWYSHSDFSQFKVGIAPRFDFRVMGGYSKEKVFVLFNADFDIKSLSIEQRLTYTQFFYNLRVTSGVRIPSKPKKKKKNNRII